MDLFDLCIKLEVLVIKYVMKTRGFYKLSYYEVSYGIILRIYVLTDTKA